MIKIEHVHMMNASIQYYATKRVCMLEHLTNITLDEISERVCAQLVRSRWHHAIVKNTDTGEVMMKIERE